MRPATSLIDTATTTGTLHNCQDMLAVIEVVVGADLEYPRAKTGTWKLTQMVRDALGYEVSNLSSKTATAMKMRNRRA